MRRAPVLLAVLLFSGCGEKLVFPERATWRTFPAPAPEPSQTLLGEEPWLLEASPWRTHYDVERKKPTRALRGAFALGNGHVFAFVGIGEPDLATIHEAIGPGYEAHDKFFSDLLLRVEVGGQPWAPTEQWQWRVERTAITLTLVRGPGLDLLLVDHAPWTRESYWADARPEERALVRCVAARATGGVALTELKVGLEGAGGWSDATDGGVRQVRDEGKQRARLVPYGPGARLSPDTNSAWLDLGALSPGAEAQGSIALVTSRTDVEEQATLEVLKTASVRELLRKTKDSWRAWASEGATLTTSEPMLDGLVEASRVLLKVQQGANGAISPMSEYSHVWLRDSFGPVVGLTALGHLDDVRRSLDYVYLWTALTGDFSNAMSAGLTVPAVLPPSPTFEGKGPLDAKVRAEGPSHFVLGEHELFRWTGQRADFAQRYPLLERAIVGQQVDAQGLLPFSGDETYRAAMAVALGYEALNEQFTEGFSSLDSSVLYVVAAEELATHARALGWGDKASALEALAAKVRGAAERSYWNEADGLYLPFLDPRGTLAAGPFEDASFKPAWLSYLGADAAKARRSLRSVAERLDTTKGFPLSPPKEVTMMTALYPAAKAGIFTGMAGGYFLGAAARADLPEGEKALWGLGQTATTTGGFDEYVAQKDNSSVAAIYDANGHGEYTARFRPWEGGLDVRAMLDWLIGLEPEPRDGGFSLRVVPRLPEGFSRVALDGARVGDARLDVEVDERWDTDKHRKVVVRRSGGEASLDVTLGMRLTGRAVSEVRRGGKPLERSAFKPELETGRLRFDLGPWPLAAGEELVVEVIYR